MRSGGIGIRLRRSRLAGSLGLMLFVSAVTVLPLLHNVHHHDDDHDHDLEGGLSWPSSEQEHTGDADQDEDLDAPEDARHGSDHEAAGHHHRAGGHEEAEHHHEEARELGVPEEARHSSDGHDDAGHHHDGVGHAPHHHAPGSPDHGHGSIEHFGAAYASSQLFVLTFGSEPVPGELTPARPEAPEPGFWPTSLQPRAPPGSPLNV